MDLSLWQPEDARADLEAIRAGVVGEVVVTPTGFVMETAGGSVGTVQASLSQRMIALLLPDTGQSRASTTVPIPAAWVAYSMELLIVSSSAEGGAAQLVVQRRANGVGATIAVTPTSTSHTLTVGPQWEVTRHVIVEEVPVDGDRRLLRVAVQRSSTSGLDTLAGNLAVVGLVVRPA